MSEMPKINIILLILLLTFVLISSGCIEKQSSTVNAIEGNSPPIAIINAPDSAYFDEKIVFDSSDSFHKDGKITSYSWDFRDGDIKTEKTSEHIFSFDHEYDIIYPMIYTVTLHIEDDNKKRVYTEHQIKLYPKNFTFYLSDNLLTDSKPESSKKYITNSESIMKKTPVSTSYIFQNPVIIQNCEFKSNIVFTKKLFTNIKTITIDLHSTNNEEVISFSKNLDNNFLSITNEIEIIEEIKSPSILKSITITVDGISYLSKIGIIQGGETPSFIKFTFHK